MVTEVVVQQYSSNSRSIANKRYIESLQGYYKKQQQYHDYPKDFPLVQAYVQRAIHTQHVSRSSNNTKYDSALLQGYESICDQLKNRDDPPMLHKVLLALAYGESLGYLIQFPQHHAKLLHLIMRLDPFTRPPPKGRSNSTMSPDEDTASLLLFTEYAIADAYFALCVAIISANATFVTPVLESMVRQWSSEALPTLQRTKDYDHEERMLRVHATIYTILRLVPNATNQLFPIIAKYFPYKMKPKELIASYVEQIFIVLRYAPSLFANIYELCIRHALQIDVEIRIQDDGNVLLEPQQPQPAEDGGVRMDDEKTETTCNDEVELANNTNDSSSANNNTMSNVDVMADKLDTIMCLIFEHLTSFCQLKIHYVEAYDILMHIFESYIMMTHKSKFVQFILLFLCGRFQQSLAHFTLDSATGSTTATRTAADAHTDPLYREFASNLINKILDVRQANIYRQVSTCYLASFISRAQYVNDQTVCETVAVLLQWAHHYIDQFDRSSASTSNNRAAAVDNSHMSVVHGVFYSICQAAFYIMCFRGADAWMHYDNTMTKFARQHIQEERAQENSDEQDDRISDMDVTLVDIGPHRWLLICAHPRLQPLKFCLESVRREFLHLAKVLKLLPPDFIRTTLQHDKLVESQKLQQRKPSVLSNGRRRSTTIQTAATIELNKKKGGVGGLGKGTNPLDSFFPFDPYLLCRSHKFISPFYKSWDEPGAEVDEKFSEDEEELDISESSSSSSSSASESSSESENCSMLHEDDDNNDITKHQDNQYVMEMLPCSFEDIIPSYRKQSISSGGSW